MSARDSRTKDPGASSGCGGKVLKGVAALLGLVLLLLIGVLLVLIYGGDSVAASVVEAELQERGFSCDEVRASYSFGESRVILHPMTCTAERGTIRAFTLHDDATVELDATFEPTTLTAEHVTVQVEPSKPPKARTTWTSSILKGPRIARAANKIATAGAALSTHPWPHVELDKLEVKQNDKALAVFEKIVLDKDGERLNVEAESALFESRDDSGDLLPMGMWAVILRAKGYLTASRGEFDAVVELKAGIWIASVKAPVDVHITLTGLDGEDVAWKIGASFWEGGVPHPAHFVAALLVLRPLSH